MNVQLSRLQPPQSTIYGWLYRLILENVVYDHKLGLLLNIRAKVKMFFVI